MRLRPDWIICFLSAPIERSYIPELHRREARPVRGDAKSVLRPLKQPQALVPKRAGPAYPWRADDGIAGAAREGVTPRARSASIDSKL